MSTPKYKISYFDIAGRAEPIRQAFKLGGIAFEDHRFKKEEWPSLKPTTPYGSVPVLFIDGKQYAQTHALLRYVGKITGLYPKDDLTALRADEILDTTKDAGDLLQPTYSMPEEEKKAAREKLVADKEKGFHRYFGALEKRHEENGHESFIVGDSLTIADLSVLSLFGYIESGFLDHIDPAFLKDYPRLQASCDAVKKALADK